MRDVVIVGGGPAGLAAALVLGRSRKQVTLFDAGEPRNAASGHVYGFLTRDGTPPAEMREIARAQLARYDTVEVRDERVLSIDVGDPFVVATEQGRASAQRILLAVGLVDELPKIAGLDGCWGKSVLHCPYCHGYECANSRFGFLPRTTEELEFALLLRGWTESLVVFSNGLSLGADTRDEDA
ncbi:MAG TPA: FAD-dependent oxidoreductase, partial [Kofleriaceae bacterium]|nr:FAD-dependent oxidoreductase [Kofleriaceae bacterium]